MPSLWNRNKKEISDIELCQGIAIDKSFFEIRESRFKTFFLKGMIVYLLTMGSIGCYLSAMDCNFSAVTLNIVIFLSAIGCAYLYYNRLVENVGYIVLFAIYLGAAILFQDYINSGFYAVVNDTLEEAAIYLDMDGMQQYNERISNRYLAITISMCFVGIVSNILLNVYISKRMQYIVAIVVVMTLNLIPLYFEREPDTIYAVMLLSGIAMTYIMKSGRHYKVQNKDSVFMQDKKKNLKYVYNAKSVKQALLLGLIYILLCVSVLTLVFPKNTFDASHADNKYKTATMETAANLFTLGIGGLFNYYPNSGGLTGGRLGGVSSIRLDYNTDIIVDFTPYSYEPVYLKKFTGETYLPYSNCWVQPENINSNIEKNQYEADALAEAYRSGEPYAAKGYMNVTNVEAENSEYLPYYSGDAGKIVLMNQTETYTYYPRLSGNDSIVPEREISENYLEIPEKNYAVIEDFCKKAGFGGTDDEIIAQVISYYQENIPYTIRPGATPRNEDFINYFLTKNKKGYCAHFASAAVLIFRYYGIPARYVEGYALSYSQVMDGELLDAGYENYYDGYSELGETGLVEVKATDADAHAWVEVYNEDYGWVVVDVTPAAGEEDTVDFWSVFQRFFDDGTDDNASNETNGGNGTGFTLGDGVMRQIAIGLLVIFCMFVLFFAGKFAVPHIKYMVQYQKADRNDRLVMKYNRYLKRMRKKQQELSERMNYREQIEYLDQNGLLCCTAEEKEQMIGILQQAGFSNREIEEKDYVFASEILVRKQTVKE